MSEIASHTESANGIVKNSPAKSIDHLQKGVVEDMNHDEDCDNDDDEEEEEGAYEVCRGLRNAGFFMVIEKSLPTDRLMETMRMKMGI